MKYDGNNWVNIGNANSIEYTNTFYLSFNQYNQPFLAFQNNEYKMAVLKYTGTN